MAKKGSIDPLLAGALGVGLGAVLWGLVLGPAPKDNLVWTGDEAQVKRIKDLLAQNGIEAATQNVYGHFAVLVKNRDLTNALAIASKAGLLV